MCAAVRSGASATSKSERVTATATKPGTLFNTPDKNSESRSALRRTWPFNSRAHPGMTLHSLSRVRFHSLAREPTRVLAPLTDLASLTSGVIGQGPGGKDLLNSGHLECAARTPEHRTPTHFAHEMCGTRVQSGTEASRRVWGGWHYSAGFAQCSVIFATACSSESMATSSLDR